MNQPEIITDPRRQHRGERPRTAEAEILADWLDSVFRVPGLNLRFGLDALLGLLPGFGDTLSAIASFYILDVARRQGVSRATITRMAGNIAVDYVVGTVPVAGDVFDVYWKSNQKNVALLREHMRSTPEEQRTVRRRDRLFVAGLIFGLIVLLVGSITLSYFLILGIWRAIQAMFG